jgi:hypothetical protein
MDEPTKGPSTAVCGYHYEDDGKCHQAAYGEDFPNVGKVCSEHSAILLTERGSTPTPPAARTVCVPVEALAAILTIPVAGPTLTAAFRVLHEAMAAHDKDRTQEVGDV